MDIARKIRERLMGQKNCQMQPPHDNLDDIILLEVKEFLEQLPIYVVGSWLDTGPRANDTYFLVEEIHFDREAALKTEYETIFKAVLGTAISDWEDVIREEEG